jgi:DnaJ-class molecular chaperone
MMTEIEETEKVCPECGGKRYLDVGADVTWRTCPNCKGTGKVT